MARLGGYELQGLIGRGSVGVVYAARHRDGGPVVAVKKLRWAQDQDVIEHLREEAATLTAIDHPHILNVIKLVHEEEALLVVTELAAGGSLREDMCRRVRLAPDEAADLISKVADALAATHERSIVHCDIKASNVLLGGDGEPLLADIGLSRWTATAGALGGTDGAAVGTAEYLDPVVAAGAAPNVTSDIYSLGVLCYEVLSGRLPYRGTTPLATLRAADRGRPTPLTLVAPHVPAGLADVVQRAMSRRPGARHTTARELAAELRSGTEGRSPSYRSRKGAVSAVGAPAGHCSGATGPRPIRPRQQPDDRRLRQVAWPERRFRLSALTAGAAMLLVAIELIPPAFEHNQPARGSSDACPAPTSTPTPAPQQPGIAGGVTMFADVAGDGCRQPVTWSSGIVAVSLSEGSSPIRFELGQAGDQFLVGHWDCHRAATPALYRPSTGQVFYFATWARPGRDLAPNVTHRTAIVLGIARVMGDKASDCDRVQVAPSQSRSVGVASR